MRCGLHRVSVWLLLLVVAAMPGIAAQCQAQCGAGSVLASQKQGMPGMPHCHMASSGGPAWQTAQPCGGTMRTNDALQPEASFHPDAVATAALIVNPVPALSTPAIHAAVQVQERPPALARMQSILRI